ncbi:TetR/AcrR family transcriptional regulator [Shimia biformata]|uniref:TetR/AcrR family transcriptional regulator n=1 Tax=Shimia biformata TaxID=1294299 RepID=UPI001951297E|nr:TetR family transcriptional regulator [Shimia biformata]
MTPDPDIALPKGERTRRKILTATLEIVARKGVNGVTHRAVARRAGVSLSTTTYHFDNLEDMLVKAWDMIETVWADKLEETLHAFIQRVDTSGLSPTSSLAFREGLRDELAYLAIHYLHNPTPDRRIRLMAEMRFTYEAGHLVELQERMDTYRNAVIARLRVLPEKAGSETPDLDASILFDAVQTMQFRALTHPIEAHRHYLLARVRRYLGWFLNCQAPVIANPN